MGNWKLHVDLQPSQQELVKQKSPLESSVILGMGGLLNRVLAEVVNDSNFPSLNPYLKATHNPHRTN